jgi:type IX secretion system PorP/SprF family membrane protein
MKKLTLFSLFLVLVLASVHTTSFAQDKQFSQFYASPLTLNPALTGNFGGKYRLAVIYRNQWQSILDSPFKTYAMSFDVRLPIGAQKTNYFGGGATFYSDKVSANAFFHNRIAMSASYSKLLGLYKKQYLTAGLDLAIAQKGVNYQNFTFNDEFNGTTGYTLPTGESLPENNTTYGDFSAGVAYSVMPKNRRAYSMGVGLHHFNFPNVSFYTDSTARLPLKISYDLSIQVPISNKVDYMPRLMALYQHPFAQLNIGNNLRIYTDDYQTSSIYLGTWARLLRDVEHGVGLDAIVLLFGYEHEGIRVGASYDANVSSLINSTKSYGAFEISLGYTVKESDNVACPQF